MTIVNLSPPLPPDRACVKTRVPVVIPPCFLQRTAKGERSLSCVHPVFTLVFTLQSIDITMFFLRVNKVNTKIGKTLENKNKVYRKIAFAVFTPSRKPLKTQGFWANTRNQRSHFLFVFGEFCNHRYIILLASFRDSGFFDFSQRRSNHARGWQRLIPLGYTLCIVTLC